MVSSMREPDEWEARQEARLRAWLEAPGTRERLLEHFGPIARRAAQVGQRFQFEVDEFWNSEEGRAYWTALKTAVKHGDKTPLVAWVERRTGHKPRSILKVHLKPADLGQDTPDGTLKAVDYWGARLERDAEAQANAKEATAVDEKSKKYPRMKRALSENRDSLVEIRRAVWVVRNELAPGESLTIGKVNYRIEADNRPLRLMQTPSLNKLRQAVKAAEEALADLEPDTPEYVQAVRALHDAEERLAQQEEKLALVPFDEKEEDHGAPENFVDDPRALAEFSEMENRLELDSFAEQDIFTPTQLAILSLRLEGYTPEEIAHMHRVKRSTVYVHLRDIQEVIRRAVRF